MHTVKESQVLQFNINNSIQYYSFVCTQLISPKYCYVSLTIQFNFNHLFTHSKMIKQFYFKQLNLAEVICLHTL